MPDPAWLCTAGSRPWAAATPAESPYLHTTVDLMRPEWDTPVRVCPWDLDPHLHLAGLSWRPVRDPPHP